MNDQIINGLVIGVAVVVIARLISVLTEMKDTRTIVKYLRESKNNLKPQFRSNHVIAYETNLPEERVRKLCRKSKKITKRSCGVQIQNK